MWLMLQQDTPSDYVIGTGEMHTVREFVETAFAMVGLDWRDHVETDPRYFRPAEVEALQADCTKAREELRWFHKTGFHDLVKIMVQAELDTLQKNTLPPRHRAALQGSD